MQSCASHPSLRMINVCCPTLGMNERGASAYRFFWLKPAALAPLRAACVDPGWTIPLSVNNRRNWRKSVAMCAS